MAKWSRFGDLKAIVDGKLTEDWIKGFWNLEDWNKRMQT